MNIILRILLYAISPILILLFSPVYLIFFIWKTLIRIVLRLRFGQSAQLMGPVDSAAVHSPFRCPEGLSCVLIEVDGPVDPVELKNRVSSKLVEVKSSNGSWKHRRLRQNVRRFGGYVIWRDYPRFNMDDHVDYWRDKKTEAVVTFKDDVEKAQVVNDVINNSEDIFQFDGRPPWKYILVPKADSQVLYKRMIDITMIYSPYTVNIPPVNDFYDNEVPNPKSSYNEVKIR
jgi:hypothetical protein